MSKIYFKKFFKFINEYYYFILVLIHYNENGEITWKNYLMETPSIDYIVWLKLLEFTSMLMI